MRKATRLKNYHGVPGFASAILVTWLTLGLGCNTAEVIVADFAPRGPAVSLDPVAPFFVPGEQITWEVTFRGIEGGRARLAVGEPTQVGGRRVLALRAEAESSGLLAVVKTVRDDMRAWLDADTTLPLESESESNVSGRETRVVTRFDHALRLAHLVVTRDGKQLPTQRRLPDGEVYDPLGVILLLRGWDAPPGAQTTIHSLGGRTLWRTDLVVARREDLKTPLGKLATVRLEGTSQRLGPTLQPDTRRPARRFSVWISADARRIPLRIRAYTELGEVDATVTSWEVAGAPAAAP